MKKTFMQFFETMKNNNNKGMRFVIDEKKDIRITYSDLYKKSLEVLSILQSNGIQKGAEVIFQIDSEETFVVFCWACLQGGIVPVPLNVADTPEKRENLIRIWNVLNNPYLLVSESSANNLSFLVDTPEYTNIINYINKKTFIIEKMKETVCGKADIYEPNPDDVALLQFSSGSTGNPKAIIITYNNLMTNVSAVQDKWKLNTKNDCCLTWMPLTHAMGLILLHLTSAYAEIEQVIMPTALFVTNPILWLKMADEYRATILSSPNFGLIHVIQTLEKKKEENIDLSRIKIICNAAEPISIEVCNKFYDYMDNYNLSRNTIVPLLGMTEATAGVTSGEIGEKIQVFYVDRNKIEVGQKIVQREKNDKNAVAIVGLGTPFSCCKIRICNENNIEQDEAIVGYIQMRGEAVTQGYYKNEEATANSLTKDGWFITGDLGFIVDGNLFITGRIKDVIFVNGQNFYLHDIERVAMLADKICNNTVVACSIENEQMKNQEVCIFVAYKEELSNFIPVVKSIKKVVNEKLGINVYDVIPVEDIPKSSTGKVLRTKLVKMYDNGEFNSALHEIYQLLLNNINNNQTEEQPQTDIEKKLLSIWKEILGGINIDVTSSYFEYGINSIQMIKVSAIMKEHLGVNIDVATLFDCHNIRNLAKVVEERSHDKADEIYPNVEADVNNMYEDFPLTEIQMAYLLGRNEGYELGGVATHSYIELDTEFDIKRLNLALNKVIKKHAMMRAVFIDSKQRILKTVPEYSIEVDDLSNKGNDYIQSKLLEERNRMSHHVFVPDTWPLFEFKALKTGEKKHYVLIGLDMLIIDAASLERIASELLEFYYDENRVIDEIDFSFRDYVLAYKEFKNSETYFNDKNYWMNKINEFPTTPNLPTMVDMSELGVPEFKRIQKLVPKDTWENLKLIATKNNVTPSTMLCTVYLEVLSYWSNQPSLAINLTAVNRYPFNKDVDKLIGDFTSVIPLGVNLTQKNQFWENVKVVQDTIISGLAHRHYDGVEFVRELAAINGFGNKVVIPIVFTSLLSNEIWGKWNGIGKINYIISQTSQVCLDYQASEMNGDLFINWDYVSNLLDTTMIEEMFEQYVEILLSICDTSNVKSVSLSTDYKKQLAKYNDTNEYIKPSLLHRLFEEQVNRTPNHIAVIDEHSQITYKELNEKANRVACKLKELGVGANSLVGVSAVRCKESIINIMGILKAGGAYVPIDPQYPQERVDYILEQSNCDLLLEPNYYVNNNLDCYSSDNINGDNSVDDIAYVIYTSGSTGKPKGVVIQHKAVANTIIDMNQKYSVGENDRFIGISSMCFDLSVYDIFGALLAGATLVQVPDQRDVFHLFDVIQEQKITIWNSVPAIMDMMLDNISSDSINDSLRLTLLSGDWIMLSLPQKINNCFTNVNIISLGGATEASIWSIFYPIKEVKPNWRSIPYGMPLANQRYYVLNYEQNICPLNVEGELYIGGVGIAKEYYGDLEKTSQAMVVHKQYGKLYRTGDYGAFRLSDDGRLYIEFMGRKDYQVKIGGYRIELTEIETNLLKQEEVKNCVVIDKTDSDQKKFLAAYVVTERDIDTAALKNHLREFVPEYMIPNYFIKINDIPLTPNGKVDRKALPDVQNVKSENSEYISPRNDVEKAIHKICSEVLGVQDIGIFDSLFKYNLNSIRTVTIISRIEEELKVKIKFTDFTRKNNIAEIALLAQLTNGKKCEDSMGRIVPNSHDAHVPFPVTEIQNAYIMGRDDQFEIGGISAHFYGEIDEKFDIDRLNRSLQKVIDRHPMLRTVFVSQDKQVILDEVPDYKIEVLDLRNLANKDRERILLEERDRMSHQIFPIDQWPLYEFKVARLDDEINRFMISYDLLVADGASALIIGNEVLEFYQLEELEKEKLPCTFRDYVIELERFKKTYTYQESKKYWLNRMEEFPSAPKLPTKVNASEIKKPHFNRMRKILSTSKWEKIKQHAQQKNITPSAVLCTAYAKILAQWSNQNRLAINMTVFNRYPYHECINDMVGDFTSTILVNAQLGSENSFWDDAISIQETIMEALEHRHFDGVEFIREISKYNNYATTAVMPIVFTSMMQDDKKKNKFDFGRFNYSVSQTPQVYLDYQVIECKNGLVISWDYVKELFDSEMLECMFEQYIGILNSIADEEEISDYILLEKEKLIIDKYNDTDEDIKQELLHKLIERQAEKNPDNIAVIDGDYNLTYRKLNEKANQVACKLQELGIGKNDLVGVLAKRCKESIINIVGILKAGGAYVPIDPQYPKDRVDYILEKSNCDIILTPDFYEDNNLSTYTNQNIESDMTTDCIAYVIYTSGSTGKPKGVVITHGAVSNTILDINRKYNVGENDRILGISSMCFDLSVYDIFGSLTSGAALVLIPDQRDVSNIYEMIEKHQITIWNTVPAIMDMMIQNIQGSISYQETASSNERVEESDYDFDEDNENKKYYWSPAISWDEEEHIDEYVYVEDELIVIFPKFYFFTQKGRYLEEIYNEFRKIPRTKLTEFIQKLIDNNILVSSILDPHSVFKMQEKLFKNKYPEDISYNPESYEKFKKKQLNRKNKNAIGEKIQLDMKYEFPKYIKNRCSHRKFNEEDKIPFTYISQLLSVFKQTNNNNHIQYYYPCAGGLYPIDIYIYVKDNRIENLNQGIYYYNPIDNCLQIINDKCKITDESQYYSNKSIFNSSAATLFMFYNAEATMPKYGGSGYFYACIDTGIIVGTMVQVAEMLNMGTCSIGDMNFEKVKDYFKLNHNQVLIHSIEIGLKDNTDITEIAFDNESMLSMAANLTENRMEVNKGKEESKEVIKYLSREVTQINNKSLRVVLLSGDWIPLSLPDKIKENFTNADVISLGGATEASIWSIYYPIVETNKNWKSIPYGIPLANQKFYILDYNGRLCHVGVAGELYIGGVGLANGYMNDEEKTKQAFIKHPIYGDIYKTGDYGVLLESGIIEFLGRKDQQVKIRGYRIELGEIENCLMKHEDVNSVAVIDITDNDGKKYLCAYVVSDNKLNTNELREHVLKELPDYMVPSHFIPIKSIPLTPNGKVCKKMLPKPEVSQTLKVDCVKPRNEIEEQILNIWKEVLKLNDIGIEENFFDVGGDSMLLVNVHSKLDKVYPGLLRITDLFTRTNVSMLAEYLQNRIARNNSKLEIQPLKMPSDYFVNRENATEDGIFKFMLEKNVVSKLKVLAENENVSIEHILLAIYTYTLNQISGEQIITVQSILDIKDVVKSLKIDFSNLAQFNELFELVCKKSGIEYQISDINSIAIKKNNNSIIPAFLKKNIYSNKLNLIEHYDYILMFEIKNDEIFFTCEYRGDLMNADHAKSMVYDYVQLINALLNQYS